MGWLGLGGALSSDDRRDIAPIVESPTFVHPGGSFFYLLRLEATQLPTTFQLKEYLS